MPVRARTLARRASWHVCLLLIMICVNIDSMSNVCMHHAQMVWRVRILPQSWYVRMDICMHVCMHAYMFPPRSARLCAARHGCEHTRPPCIITPTCYLEDIFHACMYAGRYACMLPPRSACLCSIFPSCVLACSPPFMNARSPLARCSMWLHLCLDVIKHLHAP